MALKVLIFAFLAITFAARSVESARIKPRILQGFLAYPGQFPFQVSLVKNGVHDCGGSIINERYVLTAAHCFEATLLAPDRHLVVAGTVDLQNVLETGGTIHRITKIIPHEEYDPSDSWNNDLALVKVDPPFVFTDYVAPAKLPSKDADDEIGQVARVSGFGRIVKGGGLSHRLLNTYADVISLKRCQEIYQLGQKVIRQTNVCIQNIDYETGFCNGDSGGPLSIGQKVIGVVSYSINGGCAAYDARLPQVLTKVSSYLDWIAEHTKEEEVVPMDLDTDFVPSEPMEIDK